MKTTIRTLMPFKIQNRLVPRTTFDSNSTTSAQSNQTVSITARKVQMTPEKTSVQQVPIQNRTIINMDNPRHVRVSFRRSDSARSVTNLSDSSEHLSENSSGPTYGTPQYNKTSSQYFYVPRNQGNSMSPKIPPIEPVASQYYYQMQSQITTGIKKLQELDKKLLAYQYKQPEIVQRTTIIKQRQSQQIKNIQIRNQQKQKNDLNAKKKQEYLQEILNKSKKIKQLENIIVEKDKKIIELEGQIRISAWKISRMEDSNRRGYQSPQRDNSNKLLEELEQQKRLLEKIVIQSAQQRAILQTKIEQKTKQINTRTGQQIAKLKQTFEQKESNFLKQIFALRETNQKNVINLDKEHEQNLKKQREMYEGKIKTLNEQNSKIVMKMKDDYQYERSYFNNQYKSGLSKQKQEKQALCLGMRNRIDELHNQIEGMKKIVEEKDNQIKVKSKQIQSKDVKLDQSNKIMDYYKNECKKVQTKWKQELLKRSEKDKEISKAQEQVQLLKKELGQTDKKIAEAKKQLENKIIILDLDIKKSKALEQAYFKETVTLREENQRMKQKLGQNQLTITKLEARTEKLNSVEEEYTKLKQNLQQMRIKEQKIKQLEYQMDCIKNNLVFQQQKYERQVQNIKEQFDNKSKDILKNMSDRCEQKQELLKQITCYKEGIMLKQKEVAEKDSQLLLISNSLKNVQKQNQTLKQQISEQKSRNQQINGLFSSGFSSIKQYLNNSKELSLQKYSEMVEMEKQGKNIGGVKQIMNKLCLVNKQLIEEYLLCSEELKKQKTKKNIPERDTTKVQEGEKGQKNAQTCDQIEKSQKEIQTQTYTTRKRYSIRQEDNDQIDELKMEINMLNEQAQQKEHILEVMQACIEDYKRMVNDMKSRVEAQEIIEQQYNEILQFFQIETDKTDQAAHEQLIQIITAFTNKLQKLIHTVSELETELSNASEQNESLKEKKKKMMRELKRCEQMIQKACSQNQQLEYRIQTIVQKYERSELYTKELTKMINQDNEQIVKSHLTILNFKLGKFYDCQFEEEQTQTQIKNMKRNKLFDSPCFLGSETRINTLDNDDQQSPNHKQSQPNSNIIETFEEFQPEDTTLPEHTP